MAHIIRVTWQNLVPALDAYMHQCIYMDLPFYIRLQSITATDLFCCIDMQARKD